MNRTLKQFDEFWQTMGSHRLFRAIRPNVCHRYTKVLGTGAKGNIYLKDANMGCIGVVRPFHKDYFTTSQLSKTPAGQKLAIYLCAEIKKKFPNFKFNTMQLNRNFPGNYHTDKNNAGPSVGLFVGDQSLRGGGLYVYDRTKGRGKIFNTKNKWLQFDGTNPHMTTPYKGTRYSVIFFNRKGVKKIDRRAKHFLKKLGFPLVKVSRPSAPPTKEEMHQGVEFMRHEFPNLYKHYKKINKGAKWGETLKSRYHINTWRKK